MQLRYDGDELLKVLAEAETEKGIISLALISDYYGDLRYVVNVPCEGDYRKFDFTPGVPAEEEARKAFKEAVGCYNGLAPKDKAYTVRWYEYYEGDVINKALSVFQETYEELQKLPKPNNYKVGGTYYGGTQLFSSVGNHLDLIEDKPYSSYDSYCHYSTNYSHMWGIRIGGAYELDSYKDLRSFLKDSRQQLTDAGYTIIDDYGSNFSVYGIALR